MRTDPHLQKKKRTAHVHPTGSNVNIVFRQDQSTYDDNKTHLITQGEHSLQNFCACFGSDSRSEEGSSSFFRLPAVKNNVRRRKQAWCQKRRYGRRDLICSKLLWLLQFCFFFVSKYPWSKPDVNLIFWKAIHLVPSVTQRHAYLFTVLVLR